MASVTLTISPVQLNLAPGQSLGQWHFTVKDSTGTIVNDSKTDAPHLVFDLAVPGHYSAAAERLDSNGAVFGSSVAAEFDVPAQGDAAGSLTVSLV